jgi:hypothetical protein
MRKELCIACPQDAVVVVAIDRARNAETTPSWTWRPAWSQSRSREKLSRRLNSAIARPFARIAVNRGAPKDHVENQEPVEILEILGEIQVRNFMVGQVLVREI